MLRIGVLVGKKRPSEAAYALAASGERWSKKV
jgi:hypothetical protein